jgi:hypothetical protein
MADERVCYAGDLTTDHIGRRVRVETKRGNVTSIVEDVVRQVRHFQEPATGVGPRASESIKYSEIYFVGTRYTTGSALLSVRECGLTVEHTTRVVIL